MFSKETVVEKTPVEGAVKLNPADEEFNLQIATCALCIELAYADSDYAESEKANIFSTMKSTFNLEDQHVEKLMKLSEEKAKKSTNLFEIAAIINANSTPEQKFKLIKNLWRLVFADDKLDLTEDYLIRKIGSTLDIDDETILRAKAEVEKSLDKTGTGSKNKTKSF